MRDPLIGDEVRSHLDRLLPSYRRSVAASLLVPSSVHPQIVGAAVDYAIRMEMSHLAPRGCATEWVAEHAVQLLPSGSAEQRRARTVVRSARAASKKWPDEVADRYSEIALHSVRLAQLDPVFRAGYPPTFGKVDGILEQEAVQEVRRMLEVATPIWAFADREHLALNPTFGEASRSIGGADADLVVDDMLIDIKATRSAKIERDHMRQLLGYTSLAFATGEGPKVRAVGIYFARFGVLEVIRLPQERPDSAYSETAHLLAALWKERHAA